MPSTIKHASTVEPMPEWFARRWRSADELRELGAVADGQSPEAWAARWAIFDHQAAESLWISWGREATEWRPSLLQRLRRLVAAISA